MHVSSLDTIRERLAARAPRRLSDDDDVRRAAVAAILRQRAAHDSPEVLLIRRARHPDDPWSGHMAFPGGRRESGDPDLWHTARRETLEEIGLDVRDHASSIGRLDDLEAIARGRPVGMVITPFVFELVEDVDLVPNHEVDEVLWAPLLPLARGEADTTRPYEHEGRRIDLPAFDVDGRVVWGLTYRMLQSFFEALRAEERG